MIVGIAASAQEAAEQADAASRKAKAIADMPAPVRAVRNAAVSLVRPPRAPRPPRVVETPDQEADRRRREFLGG